MNISERATAMLDYFSTHGWVKGQLLEYHGSTIIGACLAGAEYEVAGDWSLVTPAVGKIAMKEFPERTLSTEDCTTAGVYFNNHKDTTFADLCDCLEKVAAQDRELVSV